jgi:uncharacterized protein (UPF0147 family)
MAIAPPLLPPKSSSEEGEKKTVLFPPPVSVVSELIIIKKNAHWKRLHTLLVKEGKTPLTNALKIYQGELAKSSHDQANWVREFYQFLFHYGTKALTAAVERHVPDPDSEIKPMEVDDSEFDVVKWKQAWAQKVSLLDKNILDEMEREVTKARANEAAKDEELKKVKENIDTLVKSYRVAKEARKVAKQDAEVRKEAANEEKDEAKELDKLLKEGDRLEAKQEVAAKRVVTLQVRNVQLKTQKKTLEDENADLLEEVRKLRELGTLEKRTLAEEVSDARAELARLKKEIREAKNAKPDPKDIEIDFLKEERNKLRHQNSLILVANAFGLYQLPAPVITLPLPMPPDYTRVAMAFTVPALVIPPPPPPPLLPPIKMEEEDSETAEGSVQEQAISTRYELVHAFLLDLPVIHLPPAVDIDAQSKALANLQGALKTTQQVSLDEKIKSQRNEEQWRLAHEFRLDLPVVAIPPAIMPERLQAELAQKDAQFQLAVDGNRDATIRYTRDIKTLETSKHTAENRLRRWSLAHAFRLDLPVIFMPPAITPDQLQSELDNAALRYTQAIKMLEDINATAENRLEDWSLAHAFRLDLPVISLPPAFSPKERSILEGRVNRLRTTMRNVENIRLLAQAFRLDMPVIQLKEQ